MYIPKIHGRSLNIPRCIFTDHPAAVLEVKTACVIVTNNTREGETSTHEIEKNCTTDIATQSTKPETPTKQYSMSAGMDIHKQRTLGNQYITFEKERYCHITAADLKKH